MQYRIFIDGENVGYLNAEQTGDAVDIEYDYKNNGRGPTVHETIALGANGYPEEWRVEGTATYGTAIDEWFRSNGLTAHWRDTGEEQQGETPEPAFYIAHNGSPWSLGLLARLLLNDPDRSVPTLPAGTAGLAVLDDLLIEDDAGSVALNAYSISGLSYSPSYVFLDEEGGLFATADAGGLIMIRADREGDESHLRAFVERVSAARFAEIQRENARHFDGPVRIRNVRIFNPDEEALGPLVSVVWNDTIITSIEAANAPSTPGETIIDGAGGTLVPGLFDMHVHISQGNALRNLLAGVTSVRDMGNDNSALSALIARIRSGEIGGPRISRAGFIEGRSPYSSRTGILVGSEAEAVEAVRWYGARGFFQIKIYNSIDPAWVPAMIAEAHRLGMRVSGHIPAFTNANAMIEAGYDELTHINQIMLGWVLEEDEDTRTLLRFTALQRLADFDIESAPVHETLDLMVEHGVSHDPSMAIYESMLLGRSGTVWPAMAAIVDHLPISDQRALRESWLDIPEAEADEAYRLAYDRVIAFLTMMRERGIRIVPGTDMGNPLYMHRELELLQDAGYRSGEILRMATLDMARYLHQDQRLGSIERGKLADFFLIAGDPIADLSVIRSISMVVADGTLYLPSEIYPHFGVRPFSEPPSIEPSAASAP